MSNLPLDVTRVCEPKDDILAHSLNVVSKNPIQWSGGNPYRRIHRAILSQLSSAGDPVTVLITGEKSETVCIRRLVVWVKGARAVCSKDVMSIDSCRSLSLSLSL